MRFDMIQLKRYIILLYIYQFFQRDTCSWRSPHDPHRVPRESKVVPDSHLHWVHSCPPPIRSYRYRRTHLQCCDMCLSWSMVSSSDTHPRHRCSTDLNTDQGGRGEGGVQKYSIIVLRTWICNTPTETGKGLFLGIWNWGRGIDKCLGGGGV